MTTPSLTSLAGSRSGAVTLLYLQNYGRGYATEIARTFGASVSMIRKQLDKFEAGGLIVNQTFGRSRVYTWNPRFPALAELRAFLEKELSLVDPADSAKYFRKRTRPRRRGKPLPP